MPSKRPEGSVEGHPGVYVKNGRLRIRYEAGSAWTPEGPRRRQKDETVGSNSLTDADRLLAKRQREVSGGHHGEKGERTFSNLVDAYFEKTVVNVTQRTEKQYRAWLMHCCHAFGVMRVSDLSPEDIEGFYADLSRRFGPRNVRQIMGRLKAVLRKAVAWGYIVSNPYDSAEIAFKRLPKRQKPLSPDETRLLLTYVEKDHRDWFAFYLMAILTGLRLGELLACRWENIDWDGIRQGTSEWRPRYAVRETWTRVGFAPPKTAGSEDTVALSPELVEALRKHQAAETLYRGLDCLDSGLIFAKPDGGVLYYRSVQRHFKEMLTACGIEDRRFHDLRHTCATLLIRETATVKQVQRQMRHANASVTLDTYSHLFDEDRDAPVIALSAAIAGVAR
jgi:integrase